MTDDGFQLVINHTDPIVLQVGTSHGGSPLDLSALQSEVDSEKRKLAEVQQEITALQSAITDLQNAPSGPSTPNSGNARLITANTNRIATLERDAVIIKQDIVTLTNAINAIHIPVLPTDPEIGEAAFKNPFLTLSDEQKESVRDSIDAEKAGTVSGVTPLAAWIVPVVTQGTTANNSVVLPHNGNVVTTATLEIGTSVIYKGYVNIQGYSELTLQGGTYPNFTRVRLLHRTAEATTTLGDITYKVSPDGGETNVTVLTTEELPVGTLLLEIRYGNQGQDEYQFTTYSIEAGQDAPLADAVKQVADRETRLILGERPAWKDFDSEAQKNGLIGLPALVTTAQATADAAKESVKRNTASINTNHQDVLNIKKITDHATYTESSERVVSWTDDRFTLSNDAGVGRAKIEYSPALNNHDLSLVSIGATTIMQSHDGQLQGVQFVPAIGESTMRDIYYLGRSNNAGIYTEIAEDYNPEEGDRGTDWTITYTRAGVDANHENPGQPHDTTDLFPHTGNRHTIYLDISHAVNGNIEAASQFILASNQDTKTQTFDIANSDGHVLARHTVTVTRTANSIIVRNELTGNVGLTHYHFGLRAHYPVVRTVPAQPATTQRINLGPLGVSNPAAFAVYKDTTWKVLWRLNQHVDEFDTGFTSLTGGESLLHFGTSKYVIFSDGTFSANTVRAVMGGDLTDDWLGFQVAEDVAHQSVVWDIDLSAPNLGGASSALFTEVYSTFFTTQSRNCADTGFVLPATGEKYYLFKLGSPNGNGWLGFTTFPLVFLSDLRACFPHLTTHGIGQGYPYVTLGGNISGFSDIAYLTRDANNKLLFAVNSTRSVRMKIYEAT